MKSYLPEDIVHIIHLYLPIKSLLRFKGVSKSWYNSITRQQFIKDRIDRIDKSTCRCNIVFTPQGKLVPPFLHSVYYEAITTHTPMIDINTDEIDFEIVASCNDMVLIYIHTIKSLISKNFFFYNTSTRKVELSRWYYYNEGTVFALGYDKSNDEYQIIMIYCGPQIKFTQINYLITNKGLVIPDDKWHICCNLYEKKNHVPSVVVNNFPHWLATLPKVTHTMTPSIAYLGATKDYSEISLMHFELPGETGYNGDIIDLGVMSGCLCIGCNQRGERGLKIYIMTEYGCSDSWVPLFYGAPGMFVRVKPLGFLKNGRALVEVDQEKLIVYDLDEKRIEKTCFINQGGWSSLQICS